MKSLGLIGLGQFGALAATHLAPHFSVGVHDAAGRQEEIARLGLTPLTLIEAAARDVVVIAVPVQAMEGVIAAIAPHVRPGATVIDVASVKTLPAQWLARHMPDSVHIVPTHPLFGPQSAARGLADRQFVICPVRGDRHLKVAAFGEALGLRVRIVSPEEHDREMAYVQALTHLIGRSLASMNIPDEHLKTQSYQHLLDLCGLIGNDSFELFTAIQTMNPYARGVADDFVARAAALLADVNGGAA